MSLPQAKESLKFGYTEHDRSIVKAAVLAALRSTRKVYIICADACEDKLQALINDLTRAARRKPILVAPEYIEQTFPLFNWSTLESKPSGPGSFGPVFLAHASAIEEKLPAIGKMIFMYGSFTADIVGEEKAGLFVPGKISEEPLEDDDEDEYVAPAPRKTATLLQPTAEKKEAPSVAMVKYVMPTVQVINEFFTKLLEGKNVDNAFISLVLRAYADLRLRRPMVNEAQFIINMLDEAAAKREEKYFKAKPTKDDDDDF